MKSKSSLFKFRQIFLFCSFAFIFSAVSCKYDLLETPTIEPASDKTVSEYGNVISIPTDLSASHGKYRSVELRWKTIENATQYQIFAASTPYDTFTQVAETKKNETSITITETSGITKYYAIKAVNYFGTISDLSTMVSGSTLATPVITGIESSDNGTTATVTWWMDNCTEATYIQRVRYIITCYGKDKKTVVAVTTASNNSTSAVFKNLSPNTNYYYQVEAFLDTDQDNTEKSELLDAETAHRLIPNAPESLSISKGESTTEIFVSWKLPAFVDYVLAANTYAQHPVYFTLERKLASQPDTAFVKIISYLGTVKDDDNPASDAEIKISCNPASATPSTSTNLTVSSAGEATNANYEDYVPGSTITYKDTNNIERGNQYTYRIRSYVDDSPRSISSDNAVATDTGWMISIPTFQATASYNLSSDNSFYTSITTNFSLNFETFGKDDYSYFITETKSDFAGSTDPETQVFIGTSSSSVTSHTKTFTDTLVQKGYYEYKLYICSSGSGNYSSPLITITSFGKITITNNPNDIPKIENLIITDGYSDKYVLTWDYNANCAYRLKWKNYINNIEQPEQFLDIDTNDPNNICTIDNSTPTPTITVNHLASSGDNRKYVVVAISGANKETDPTDMKQTLGTAAVEIASYEYDSIKVRWPVVQKATGYTVKAEYEETPGVELIQESDSNNPGYGQLGTATINEKEYITYTISMPDGYNDQNKSGKPIKFTVTSENNNVPSSNTTLTQSTVRTLGPALAGTAIDDSATDNSSIGIRWNKMEGASGYQIYRVKYDYNDFSAIDKADMYYYDCSDNKLKRNGEEVDSSRATVRLENNQYLLKDTAREDDSGGTDSYKINQAEICIGIPYGYVVLPVKQADDAKFDLNTLNFDSSSAVKFTNLTDLKNASYGYGINLFASKATSSDTQTLSWTAPYNSSGRVPAIYRRSAGSNGSWTNISSLTVNSTSASFTVPKSERENVYEYTVKYNSTDDITMETAMLKKLANKPEDSSLYETGIEPEQANLGYLLYINFTAKNGATVNTPSAGSDYYSEKIEWSKWDYSKRKIGPQSAKIYIYNKNIGATWQEVAALDKNCQYNSHQALTDVTISPTQYYLILKPTAISNGSNDRGTTDGYLKILRDARHYYKLELKRSNSIIQYVGGLTEGLPNSNDNLIYAYRNITKEELVKSALLQISYAFYRVQGGASDYSNISNKFKYSTGSLLSDYHNISGNAFFDKTYGLHGAEVGKSKATFKLTNYVQPMKCPDATSAAFLVLKTNNEEPSVRIRGVIDSYIDKFRTDGGINFTINPVDSFHGNNITLPSSYTATLNLVCTDDKTLTVKLGSETICDVSTLEDRRKWFPIQLHDGDNNYWLTSTTYGWWPQ